MGRAYIIAGMLGGLALQAGCPGGAPPTLDAGDDDDDGGAPDEDGGGGTGGLTFEFVATPELPSDPDGAFSVVITSGRYQLANVRAVGDAAPGDERTSVASFDIDFEQVPVRLAFPAAPQGIYSFLLADVIEYEVDGTLDGTWSGDAGSQQADFEIRDQPFDLELAIELDGLVLGDQPVTCIIEMDLRKITREVDWADEDPDDEDGIEIEQDHPDIDQLRDKADDFRKQ